MNVKDINIKDIQVKENVRAGSDPALAELMRSIKQHGLQEPIGVLINGNKYDLAFGWRRLEACRKLDYRTIPATIGDKADLKDLLVLNIIENTQRRNVTPYELGRMCQRLLAMKFTMSEISAKLDMPMTKVKMAIEAFKSTPKKLRSKVKFMGAGGESKKGYISASAAYRIMQLSKEYGFKDKVRDALLELSREWSLPREQMQLIGVLMKQGLNMKQAYQESTKYQVVRANLLVYKEELHKLAKKYKIPRNDCLSKIVYGKIENLTMPDLAKYLKNKGNSQ